MEDLSINISGTTATDLLINSGAGATAGSSYGDSTKSTCEVESLIIDTPIKFNRSTDSILANVENASDDITIYIDYQLTKVRSI